MMSGLHLLRPEWLWLLLALPAIAWAWWHRRRRNDVWGRAVDPELLPHLIDRRVARHGIAALVLQCTAWALAVVALAGPSWRTAEQAAVRGGAPMVIALDLSDATLAGDLPPSRLLQARARLAQLLQARNGQPTALVAYAGDAFTVSPVTVDTANITLFLDALAPDIMPEAGSRASRAIEMGILLLSRAGFAQGDVLLLTDHADADAVAAAARARASGYRISALGMGTPAGAAYRRGDGSIVQARLDAASLSAVSTAGGGVLKRWHEGLDGLGLAGGDDAVDTVRGSGLHAWRDEGYWLLPLLMLLALFAFRRGAAVAVLALCMVLPLPQARAQSGDAQSAEDGGLWRRADQAQHARMREGIDAFRNDDLDRALQAWNGLPGAEAAYNRGNALARQGKFADAIAAYDAALQHRPGMADAIANRKAVEAAMQRRPPGDDGPRDSDAGQDAADKPQPGQGNGAAEPGDPGNPADGGDPASSAQGASQQDADADRSRAQQRQSGESSAAGPPPPSDPEAQRAADAAQRERIQSALQRQGTEQADDGEHVEGRPERAESAAEREKRQANEAWLRRIPDDPGGLLRAKFKLEHERRAGRGGRS